MYRDQIERIKPELKLQRRELKEWLKSHVISYVFIGDEFIPNPDAKFADD